MLIQKSLSWYKEQLKQLNHDAHEKINYIHVLIEVTRNRAQSISEKFKDGIKST